jgi:TPP-dependent 2-oxoacid decarboxylase
MPTIAIQLLDRLAEAGVRHVFGVPGDYNLRLLDAVEAHPRLEWAGNANELGAAYAADGYARVRGIAALITTYGVGELSALNGVAGSFAESVPVLMIAGAPPTTVQEADLPVHHSLLDGDWDVFARAYAPVTCAAGRITADNATAEIDRVLGRVLAEGRPGYLMLPSDLVDAPARSGYPPAPPLLEPPPGFAVRALALLEGAERVVVLADHLARRHRGRIDALIRAGGLASATLAPAKSLIDETLPGYLGVYMGALSPPGVREAVEDADVVIAAGLRPVDLSSGGFTMRLDTLRLIDLQADHAIVGGERFDGVALPDALTMLARLTGRHTPAAAAAPVPEIVAGALREPLTQAAFWRRVGSFLRERDLLAADQGTSFSGVLGLRLPAGAELIAQPIWSSIGYSLPALLGAQLAAPERRAVLFIGDGSFQMTAQELGTFARHGLAPKVFLLNNDGYAVERAINGPDAGYNDIARWNWSHVPAAFGAEAFVARVATLAELEAALHAITRGTMAFVEVVLARDDVPPGLAEVAHAIARSNAGAAAG